VDSPHVLPWQNESVETRRFQNILLVCIIIFIVAGIIVPLIDLPERTRAELEALPPQLARVVINKRELPESDSIPLAKPSEPERIPEHETKPEPEIKPKPVVKPETDPRNSVQLAREKAKTTGLLALRDELSELRALANNLPVNNAPLLTAKPITRKPSTGSLENELEIHQSRGIDTSQLDKSTQKIALASRSTTEVESTLSNEIAAQQLAIDKPASGEKSKARQSGQAGRTGDEIKRIIDANKRAITNIYRKELRKDPTLKGTLVPEFVVSASGKVASCRIVESELGKPALEKKLCNRIMLIDFGVKKNSADQTFRYPIEFFPS
jgi:protein TonB